MEIFNRLIALKATKKTAVMPLGYDGSEFTSLVRTTAIELLDRHAPRRQQRRVLADRYEEVARKIILEEYFVDGGSPNPIGHNMTSLKTRLSKSSIDIRKVGRISGMLDKLDKRREVVLRPQR
ncbi:MAG TPA: hypothetical protein VF189_00405 [Patescibacteria group bacterium]